MISEVCNTSISCVRKVTWLLLYGCITEWTNYVSTDKYLKKNRVELVQMRERGRKTMKGRRPTSCWLEEDKLWQWRVQLQAVVAREDREDICGDHVSACISCVQHARLSARTSIVETLAGRLSTAQMALTMIINCLHDTSLTQAAITFHHLSCHRLYPHQLIKFTSTQDNALRSCRHRRPDDDDEWNLEPLSVRWQTSFLGICCCWKMKFNWT